MFIVYRHNKGRIGRIIAFCSYERALAILEELRAKEGLSAEDWRKSQYDFDCAERHCSA